MSIYIYLLLSNSVKYIFFKLLLSLLIKYPLCNIVYNVFNSAGSLQIDNSLTDDQGKYECVAENSVGTEHSKPTALYVKVRRVPPQFSVPPEPLNEVMLGANLTLTCVAVGSPMPYVKWKLGKSSNLRRIYIVAKYY